MTKVLKELLENAPVKKKGKWAILMIVPNGVYNGFWGKNGFNNIALFGMEKNDKTWYKISEHADKLDIFLSRNSHFNLDIPQEYNVPRIWFKEPITIEYDDLSQMCGYEEDASVKNLFEKI